MFSWDATCCDCYYMATSANKDGKFKCDCKKSGYDFVSANMRICNEARESWRDSWLRKECRDISRSHGYYVTTAISVILNLGMDNKYIDAFKYIRDVIMPNDPECASIIECYEVEGPVLAAYLIRDNDIDYAEYLKEEYLDDFVSLVEEENYLEAITIYFSMIGVLKNKYFTPHTRVLK